MPVQTFVVDLRKKPLGGESLVSPMLYPLMRDRDLVHLEYPGAYAYKEELKQLTIDLHIHLQRSNTRSDNWTLAVLMDQNADAGPDWGSLSHQIHALRHEVFPTLEDEFGQEPTFTLGLLFDQWDRTPRRQIPTSAPRFVQWSIDHFGMLHEDLFPSSNTIPGEPSAEYPHLLTKTDLDRLNDEFSESRIDDLFDQKIQACKSVRQKSQERGDIHPPVRDIKKLSTTRDKLKKSLGESDSLELVGDVQDVLSALGPDLCHMRNDLALLRIPVRENPLSDRRQALIYRDYILGVLPHLPGRHLEDELANQNNKETRAYWVGRRKESNQVSQIRHDEDDLCAAAKELSTRLQQAKDSFTHKNLEDYKIELFEPFDHSCDLEDSDDWRDTVENLSSFSFLRTSQINRWSRWVETVDATIKRRDARLSSELTDCLLRARQEWRSHPTRVHEGSDIEDLVNGLRRKYRKKRERVFAESPDGFMNDWRERASAHADNVRRAFRLRPTRRRLQLAIGTVFFLLLLSLLVISPLSLSQQFLSIGFWTGACILVVGIGFYLARQRLVSKIQHRTEEGVNEAKLVLDNLHQFVQDRQEMIEQYFQVLAAKRNLERAEQRRDQIEQDRLHDRHHRQALREHSENMEALQHFLGCSTTMASSTANTFTSNLDRADAPPFESSLYALRGANSRSVEVLGYDDIETDLLPGLNKIGFGRDPAFQVSPDSDSASEG